MPEAAHDRHTACNQSMGRAGCVRGPEWSVLSVSEDGGGTAASIVEGGETVAAANGPADMVAGVCREAWRRRAARATGGACSHVGQAHPLWQTSEPPQREQAACPHTLLGALGWRPRT